MRPFNDWKNEKGNRTDETPKNREQTDQEHGKTPGELQLQGRKPLPQPGQLSVVGLLSNLWLIQWLISQLLAVSTLQHTKSLNITEF